MGYNRKRASRRTQGSPNASSKSDDSGCLLVLLGVLWYFGFVSFHSREKGRAIDRLEDVHVELAKAQGRLEQITKVASEIKAEASVLDARRTSLHRKVAELERTRDQIARNLDAAAKAISPQQPASRWDRLLESIFTGVIGNFVSAGLLAFGSWFVGKRLWRARGRREGAHSGEEPTD